MDALKVEELTPSKLGTKEYWEEAYNKEVRRRRQNDVIQNCENCDVSSADIEDGEWTMTKMRLMLIYIGKRKSSST